MLNFYGSIFAKMNKLEQTKSAGATGKQGTAPMTIDRLRRLVLRGGLAEKALRAVDLVRSERANGSVIPARLSKLWLISLLMVVIAVLIGVFYHKSQIPRSLMYNII
ncbi:hypothetical protein Sango_0780900 [Sesamum angolense]|uniref:Uncharacterized protein n=1 Tax=Sesamum angolense TaxID=2727404 RepID=A0AAE1X2L8_9LAMI|nr:hypothetical protein Sango_0780900 [Sesamum angolense]